MTTKRINGIQKTRDQAVVDNLRLVTKVANIYERYGKQSGFDFDDLVSYGSIGLLKAFDEFEDSKGFQFSTFATWKIRGEITTALKKGHVGVMRYPANIIDKAKAIKKQGMENESIDVLMSSFHITKQTAKAVIEYLTQNDVVRLDEQVKEHKVEGSTYYDVLGIEQDFTAIFVGDFLSGLQPRENEFVIALMGGYNRAEVSRLWGVSTTVPTKLINRIRPKLKAYLQEV